MTIENRAQKLGHACPLDLDVGEEALAPDDFSEVVMLVARLLDAVGERLREGDWIIGGSLTPQVDVGPGDHVVVDLGRLGSVEAQIT